MTGVTRIYGSTGIGVVYKWRVLQNGCFKGNYVTRSSDRSRGIKNGYILFNVVQDPIPSRILDIEDIAGLLNRRYRRFAALLQAPSLGLDEPALARLDAIFPACGAAPEAYAW